jgi:hypothetical protein
MSKYIPQINNENFVFPNYELAEYDVDIIHSLNEESVSGTITNFTGTSITSTGATFTHDWSWSRNGADVVIANNGNINLLSVHVLAPGQNYFKPWRCVDLVNSGTTTGSTYSGTNTITITPSQMGLTSFSNGTFYFEFRFIGEKAIYPLCQSYVASSLPTPTPTPTMTPTPTPVSPTPTPTPTPTGTFTSGATINVTNTGYIKYRLKGASVDTYTFVGSLGNYTITGCLICSSIQPGIPFADIANFTLITCGAPC